MKKLINKLFMAGAMLSAMTFNACTEPESNVFEGPYYVRFSTSSAVVSEAEEGETITNNISVHLVGPAQASDVTVAYEISGSAESGSDYILANAGTVTIPAGEHFATISITTVNNDIAESTETIELSLTSVDGANLRVGQDDNGMLGANFTLTINDDDCPIVIASSYTVSFTDPSWAAEYDRGSVSVTDNGDGTYSIENVWGDFVAFATGEASYEGSFPYPITFTVDASGNVTVPAVDGDWKGGGAGKVDACNGVITIVLQETLFGSAFPVTVVLSE
ncbi:Calx-beta domain-containing protein [Algivirga pacifica]|uniref:Calx-beta domain-containing protein n=1 Tax=Algivirga pacifica TaxID=1162670 RepID=A0ABP9DKL2_9BACT